MTDVDRKTKNIVVRCLRPYKGYGLLRESVRDMKAVDIETMSWEGLAADRTKWRRALKQHPNTCQPDRS